MDDLVFPLPLNFFTAGTRVEDGSLVAILNRLNATSYSNATRPDANTVPVGTMIFNTDDGAPNWSNGTHWVDATGTITS